MGLFGFKNKDKNRSDIPENKYKSKSDVSGDKDIKDVNSSSDVEKDTKSADSELKTTDKINIKILGEGCEKCDTAFNRVKESVSELGIDAEIEKIEDLLGIVAYGVMSTPGIVINDRVVSVGRVLSVSETSELIKKNI